MPIAIPVLRALPSIPRGTISPRSPRAATSPRPGDRPTTPRMPGRHTTDGTEAAGLMSGSDRHQVVSRHAAVGRHKQRSETVGDHEAKSWTRAAHPPPMPSRRQRASPVVVSPPVPLPAPANGSPSVKMMATHRSDAADGVPECQQQQSKSDEDHSSKIRRPRSGKVYVFTRTDRRCYNPIPLASSCCVCLMLTSMCVCLTSCTFFFIALLPVASSIGVSRASLTHST
jgi:hypothetical protein